MSKAAIKQTDYNYCALPLAAYACRPDLSRGRIYEEQESSMRTSYQRDRDRIIHSTAFRRLKYKTQVFIYHEGDHYRTRLTHSLEVAQIARALSRALMINEDLTETVALAHDLGHTPFAHMGEDVLTECMKDVGGFDHNDQSLRVLTTLECHYPDWQGLNLTWETLEGVAKHNGPVIKKGQNPDDANLPITLAMVQKQKDLYLDSFASVEAQIAGISDDIAYNNHDLEDGLRSGLLSLEDIGELQLVAEIVAAIKKEHPDIDEKYMRYEVVRETTGAMVEDVMEETKRRLSEINPQSPDDIRAADRGVVDFSDEMLPKVNELRAFLRSQMYNHPQVSRMRHKVCRIIEDLYNEFMDHYILLPEPWQKRIVDLGGVDDKVVRARTVADYIAGMTDRYAVKEHERLFELYYDLR
jgi:dGTPase